MQKLFFVATFVVFSQLSIFASSGNSQNIPYWSSKIKDMQTRFELAKRSTPELIMFLRSMPKGGELHNHVCGASYTSFILETAAKNKLNYDLTTNCFTKQEIDGKNIISLDQLMTNNKYLGKFRDISSMRGWKKNTTNGHDHFFDAFPHVFSAERTDNETLAEMAARNIYQKVSYLELMAFCVPDNIAEKFYNPIKNFDIKDLDTSFMQLKPLIDNKEIADAIVKYIDRREDYIEKNLSNKYHWHIKGKNPDIVIRYIIPVERERKSLKNFFIDCVMSIVAINADSRIVGMNVVAPEDYPYSYMNFQNQMKILNYLWHKMGHPKFTLHAGELVLNDSPVEAMWNRISDTINIGHALRIGHGVDIAWERHPIKLLKEMKEKGIPVEICLSSNEGVLNKKGKDHPFSLYRRAGVPVCINTDDEGVTRSNLTMEYVKAVQRYNLSYDELKKLIKNSIKYSFLPEKEKKALLGKVEKRIQDYENSFTS